MLKTPGKPKSPNRSRFQNDEVTDEERAQDLRNRK